MLKEKNRFADLVETPLSEGIAEAAKTLLEKGAKDGVKYKTEIHNPLALTILARTGLYAKERKLPKTARLIESFLGIFETKMVSYKRKSRAEFIEALKAAAAEKKKEDALKKLAGETGE